VGFCKILKSKKQEHEGNKTVLQGQEVAKEAKQDIKEGWI